jgi:plasmid stabilization system protein ParE
MSRAIQRAGFFIADFERQFAWYVDKAGDEIAVKFQVALDASLQKLSRLPDLGQIRHFRHPKLQNLRSYRVERPFDKLLIFYRVEGAFLQAVRLMHGSRDLPRRLVESPGFPTH